MSFPHHVLCSRYCMASHQKALFSVERGMDQSKRRVEYIHTYIHVSVTRGNSGATEEDYDQIVVQLTR